MKTAMVLGSLLCLALGFIPALAIGIVGPAAEILAGQPGEATVLGHLLKIAAQVSAIVAGLVLGLVVLRGWLLRGRRVERGPTWGCGYRNPSPRMQYTAMSIVDPVRAPFAAILRARVTSQPPVGFFPQAAHYEDRVRDMAGERVLVPLWRRFLRLNSRMRVIQSGRMQLYLSYILATLVALLLWQIGGALGG